MWDVWEPFADASARMIGPGNEGVVEEKKNAFQILRPARENRKGFPNTLLFRISRLEYDLNRHDKGSGWVGFMSTLVRCLGGVE